MTVYTEVFGGNNISPSELSYSAVALTANTVFDWPLETAPSSNLIANIMDVTASSGPFSITMPDARQASRGQAVLFNNVGANSFTVKDAGGTQLLNAAAGEVWQLYLTDNSDEDGTWRAYQFGAAVSSANAASLAGVGITAIGAFLQPDMPVTEFSNNYTSGASDRAITFVWTGGAGVLTLPAAASATEGWFIQLRNEGTGALSVAAAGSETINGDSTLSFQPRDSAIILCDGLGFYTIGYGQAPVFAFDFTSIDVAGSGNYTLAGSELNRIAYSFTGLLTGNRSIIVPPTIQQYWVSNDTTGSFTLTVKVSGQTGTSVTQGGATILYCNGTDVVLADTGGISTPIQITEGGTGATSASQARLNLGGTTVGVAVFTAASESAAQIALGLDPINGGTY